MFDSCQDIIYTISFSQSKAMKIMPFVPIWINLEIVAPNEVSQTEEDI